ncbi:hypothetical protein J1N35_004897 [Gossypium stocksii]|uniref:Uncharacterized protein n=1 Tax=Gossypium stocksii TaxID=47602 RepID=A0A9D3WCV9_9ROSI|nr:hypothetical protein J1N35_004897 [Gossypium stocksii]
MSYRWLRYTLSHSNPQDEYEEFLDHDPPHHADLPRSLPLGHPTATPTVTLEDLSEWFDRFKQRCFDRFNSIEAYSHQICQHLHISQPDHAPHDPDNSHDTNH